MKTIFNYHPWNQLKNNKDFNTLFNLLQADIITLQELKLTETSLQQQMSQLVHLSDYKSFISIPVTKKDIVVLDYLLEILNQMKIRNIANI